MKKTIILGILSLFLVLGAKQTNALTYYVNTTIDDNGACNRASCSLREAIIASDNNPGDDIIRFRVNGTHTLNLGALQVLTNDQLTIIGNGKNFTIINGNDYNSAIELGFCGGMYYGGTTGTLNLRNLQINNGMPYAILQYDDTNLSMNNVALINNQTGLYIGSSGNIIIQNSTISDNSSNGILGLNNVPSGKPNIIIENSIFDNNQGSGIEFAMGDITITNSQFKNNQNSGMHLYNAFGTTASYISVSISDSLIINNYSSTNGGGIYIENFYNLGPSGDYSYILEEIDVEINNSTIKNNKADENGGGIYNAGTLNLVNSTISNNFANLNGGGIYNSYTGLTINQSTVGENSANGSGGGIYGYEMLIANSTITHNTADADNNLITEVGGGIYIDILDYYNSLFGNVNIKNSIIQKNVNSQSADCYTEINAYGSAKLLSNGYIILGNTGGCNYTSSATDNISTASLLSPLNNNGGITNTYALNAGTAAVDAIPAASCTDTAGNALTSDQRGYFRPVNGNCDIGSYEIQ